MAGLDKLGELHGRLRAHFGNLQVAHRKLGVEFGDEFVKAHGVRGVREHVDLAPEQKGVFGDFGFAHELAQLRAARVGGHEKRPAFVLQKTFGAVHGKRFGRVKARDRQKLVQDRVGKATEVTERGEPPRAGGDRGARGVFEVKAACTPCGGRKEPVKDDDRPELVFSLISDQCFGVMSVVRREDAQGA